MNSSVLEKVLGFFFLVEKEELPPLL